MTLRGSVEPVAIPTCVGVNRIEGTYGPSRKAIPTCVGVNRRQLRLGATSVQLSPRVWG